MKSTEINVAKSQLRKQPLDELKAEVEKEAWIALKAFFDGTGSGIEAKIAVVALGVLARELQAKNNARQLELMERRLSLPLPVD